CRARHRAGSRGGHRLDRDGAGGRVDRAPRDRPVDRRGAPHAAHPVPRDALGDPRRPVHPARLAVPLGAGCRIRVREPRLASLPARQLPRRLRRDPHHRRDHAHHPLTSPHLKQRTMSHAAPSRTRRTLRILIPALLVLVWLTVAAIGGPYFGKVSEVSSNDPTAYLPTTAEATQVQERLSDFLGTDAIPAVVLVLGDGTLSDAQLEELKAWPDELADLDGVVGEAGQAVPRADGVAGE